MADEKGTAQDRAEVSAQKAYAAAAEAVPLRPSTEDNTMPETDAPVSDTPEVAPLAEPTMDVIDLVTEAPEAPVAAKPARKPRAKKAIEPAPVAAPEPVKVRKAPAKRTAAKPVAAKPAPRKTAKTVSVKPKPAPKPAAKIAAPAAAPVSQVKEMMMDKTSKLTDGIKTVVAEAQEKAKAAYAKGSEFVGEYTEFTKGNVEAMVESGKILAAGIQDMGTTLVADTKDSFETMTADVKAIAAVKSPTELVKLQGEMMRRNLDKAVAYSSKNSEAMLKLANEVFAPISGRFSLAMEKVRKAA